MNGSVRGAGVVSTNRGEGARLAAGSSLSAWAGGIIGKKRFLEIAYELKVDEGLMLTARRLDSAFYTPGARVQALDGLRGVAILLVMLVHFTQYGMRRPSGVLIDQHFWRVAAAGWVGVDLFFVLSGLLITGILLDSKGGDQFFRNFYIRRVLRIFPLYYGTLVGIFLIVPQLVSTGETFRLLLRDQGWYWSYLINFPVAFEGWPAFGVIGHFWSLAIEEQFYLVWPFVVFFFTRQQLTRICVGCFGVSFLVRFGFMLAGYPLAGYVLTIARMDALAVGALLAVIFREPNHRAIISRWVWPAGVVSGAVLISIFAWRGFHVTDKLVLTIGFSALALMFGAVVSLSIMVAQDTWLGKLFSHPILITFGRYSYALYIFHPIVIFAHQELIGKKALPFLLGSQLPALGLLIATLTGATLFIAWCSWHAYESHFLKLKSLFPYHTSKVSISAAATELSVLRK
jgi:peptidoglycan/LPS O-acetylase OafA/YrhL